MAGPTGARTDVLILCCGSRGDTEPWALLAARLRDEGLSVCVAAHAEYAGLVQQLTAAPPGDSSARAGPPVLFREIRGSLPRALVETPEGAALRAAKGLSGLAAGRALMVPLAGLWLEDALAAARELRPRLVVATTMHLIAGAWLIPTLLAAGAGPGAGAARGTGPGPRSEAAEEGAPQAGGEQQQTTTTEAEGGEEGQAGGGGGDASCKFAVAHTVLTTPTGQYAPATAGVGQTLPLAFLNRLLWWFGLSVARRHLYQPMWDAVAQRHGLDPASVGSWMEHDAKEKPLTLYVYSPTLLPPARDWGPHIRVAGPLVPPAARAAPLAPASAEDAEAAVELPEGLRQYIAGAKRAGVPVVYIGLGSMLGVYYENPKAVLETLAGGVAATQAGGAKFAAVIHTVTGAKGESEAMPPAPAGANYLWLSQPVPHAALLPLVDLVVHHGGMGTTHAAALAGRPAIVAPASLVSDQPFWGDVLRRRGCGLASASPAGDLTAASFGALLKRALGQLPALSAAAAATAERMRAEPEGLAEAAAALHALLDG